MEKQKVFIQVDVEKEMPEIGSKVSVSFSGGKDFNNLAVGKKGWTANDVGYSHWLKEQEGYFMNQADFEKELRKAFRKGERYGFAGGSDTERYTNHMNEDEYIQSLNIK